MIAAHVDLLAPGQRQPRGAVVESVDLADVVEVDDDLPVNAVEDLRVELAFEFGQRRVFRPEFALRRGRADQAAIDSQRRDLIDVQNQDSILRDFCERSAILIGVVLASDSFYPLWHRPASPHMRIKT